MSIERLDDALVLEAQALPDPDDWDRAVELANTVFGIEVSPLMNAQNVAELAQALRHATGEHREAVGALADALKARLDARGIRTADTDRFRTADATLSLLSALDHAGGRRGRASALQGECANQRRRDGPVPEKRA